MDPEIKGGYRHRLQNKLFGLLCEFEKSGNWESCLDSIIIELEGVPESEQTINYITLCNKVNMLRYLRYEYFRKTIFDCMTLLSKGEDHGVL